MNQYAANKLEQASGQKGVKLFGLMPKNETAGSCGFCLVCRDFSTQISKVAGPVSHLNNSECCLFLHLLQLILSVVLLRDNIKGTPQLTRQYDISA